MQRNSSSNVATMQFYGKLGGMQQQALSSARFLVIQVDRC
jgi:hypothetical protein